MNLESAFSNKSTVFQILDRRRIDQVVKANHAEKEIEALSHGEPASLPLARLLHADAVVHGELSDTPDGVVLTVTLTKLNSELLWQGRATHSRAQWLVGDIQEKEARRLAAEAAAKLRPGDESGADLNVPDPNSPAALSDAIAKGIQMYASGQALTPKALAQSSYDRLTDFLNSQQRSQQRLKEQQEQIQQIQQRNRQQVLQPYADRQPANDTGSVDRYHSIGLYRIVVNTLDSLKLQRLSVTHLSEMNENLKTIDDIQQLANALKSFSDPRSQKTYTELVDFLDTERRLQARSQGRQQAMAQHPLPTYQSTSPANSETQTMNVYHAAYARIISNNLDQLRAKKVDVASLVQINNNANSVEDIQKLADGFKKLADSLPPQ